MKKKFEVSCKAGIPKNKYKKKLSIPILKTRIKGRERSEGEKDSDQRERDSSRGDPGIPKPRWPKPRWPKHASPKPRQPRRTSLRPGSRIAWGWRGLGQPGARAPGLGRARPGSRAAWGSRSLGQPRRASPRPGLCTMVNSDLRSRSSLPFCFWVFFFSRVLLWCSSGSSLTWSYL